MGIGGVDRDTRRVVLLLSFIGTLSCARVGYGKDTFQQDIAHRKDMGYERGDGRFEHTFAAYPFGLLGRVRSGRFRYGVSERIP